jgi:response regulator RpfG family c-di-GMP phosphodiesterase
MSLERSLVVLLLDGDGQRSSLAQAVRSAGHRVVTAQGIDTALVVLAGLVPDLILVRRVSPESDRQVAARIHHAAPGIATRFVEITSITSALEPPALN